MRFGPGFEQPKITDERAADPPTITPPSPNLDGHDVKFVRRAADGSPLNWGHMHRDHFEDRKAKGDNIEEVADDFVPPPPSAPDDALHAQFLIAGALEQTDKYFMSDALDNITPAEQAQWRAYRQKLRAANKLGNAAAIVANVPPDPKGVDRLGTIRGKPTK